MRNLIATLKDYAETAPVRILGLLVAAVCAALALIGIARS
jgi:hypothetical protein